MNIFGCVSHLKPVPMIMNEVKQRLHLPHGESEAVDSKFIEAVPYSGPRRERQLDRCIWLRRGYIRSPKPPIVPAGLWGPAPYWLAACVSIFNDNPEPPSTALGVDIS